MKKDKRFLDLLENYRLNKTKAFFQYSRFILTGLYLSFWLIDLAYAPEHKWTFLLLRLAFIPPVFIIYNLSKRSNSLEVLRNFGVLYSFISAGIINLMIVICNDPISPYYAGLNLVALCGYLFFPLNLRYFTLFSLVIYVPYLAFASSFYSDSEIYGEVLVNMAFVGGTILIGFLFNKINDLLEEKYIQSNLELERTIAKREFVIKQKTKEALKLELLSSQFSPQIIEAIKRGEREINTEHHRAEICAIFIDIVNSTDRLVKLEHSDFLKAIEFFMETCINTLLKYDLTIDKFYGDGVLAFSNDPVRRTDFVQRTCLAATEIKEQIEENQEYLKGLWKQEFQLTMGISSGFSSVGFYGNTTYIKQYSAIGTCLPFSQRLSSVAEPGEILIDQRVADRLTDSEFAIEKKGARVLKGFGDEEFEVFNILSRKDSQSNANINTECPSCHENSIFIDEVNGIYTFKCRKCGYSEGSKDSTSDQKKSA